MSCSDVCIDMDTDGIYNDFHSVATRRARKPHQCEECHDQINPGDRYEYASGKNEAGFFDVRTCLVCAEVRKTFVCGSFYYGQLWEEFGYTLFDAWKHKGTMIDCLAKLETLEAREMCRRQYKEWLGEDEAEVAA